MRVVTNDATIDRNRRIAQYSFFFSIFVLLGSFIFLNSLSPEGSSLACFILPLAFLITLFSVRMGNNWIREPLSWEAIQESTRGISSNAVLYHFILPAKHVFISPMGIFAFYTMFQDRHIVVKDDKWRMTGGLIGSILTFMRQDSVGNPTREAQFEAQVAEKTLQKIFPDKEIEVQPIIVFLHPGAKVDIEGEQTVPITFATGDSEPSLKLFLKSLKEEDYPTLTSEEIDELDDELIYVHY